MLKKSITISFLSVFFLSQVGYYFFYTVKLYQAKKEAQRKVIASIPDSYFDMVCLEDNSSKIKWEEEGKEFSLNGRMYDVARIKQVDGKTMIYCYNDSKEENLISDFSKKVNNQNNAGGKRITLKMQANDWINSLPQITLTKNIPVLNRTQFPDRPERICSFIREVTSPPPDGIAVSDNIVFCLPAFSQNDEVSLYIYTPVRSSYRSTVFYAVINPFINCNSANSGFGHSGTLVYNKINLKPNNSVMQKNYT